MIKIKAVSKRKEKDKEKDSKSAELEETFSSISASNSFNNYLNSSQIEQVGKWVRLFILRIFYLNFE